MAKKNFCMWLLVAASLAYPAAGFAQNADVQSATTLYAQHNYSGAAEAFERAMHSAPSARVCYYAALSNKAAGRSLRARQLFQYLVTAYPRTAEAQYAQQALAQDPGRGSASTKTAQSDPSDLPDSVKNSLPPEMRALLNSPNGKRAIQQVMREHPDQIATIREAEDRGLMDQNRLGTALHSSGMGNISPTARNSTPIRGKDDHPFSAADIARDGADGIDQSRHPNCWFEASMASLAQLPHGQRLLSSMIRSKGDDYVVRFPGDGVEYQVTQNELRSGQAVADRAQWASIIELAQCKKFPDNKGAEGADGDQCRLEVGLGCITGCKAQIIMPRNCSAQELSSFIGGAVTSGNPIVCGTWQAAAMGPGPIVVIPTHAYTIIGFDPSKNMVILRNPHGRNSQRFSLASDPNHQEFQQLDDGVVRLSIPLFQRYYSVVARSFI